MDECCIYLEQFQLDGDKTPKLFLCTHTLCLQCLQELSDGRPDIQCPVQSADEVIQSMMYEIELEQNEVNENGGTEMTLEPLISLYGNFILPN